MSNGGRSEIFVFNNGTKHRGAGSNQGTAYGRGLGDMLHHNRAHFDMEEGEGNQMDRVSHLERGNSDAITGNILQGQTEHVCQ